MPGASEPVTVVSRLGHTIRIPDRQWKHVVENHDYMSGNLDKVLETIGFPDLVLKGNRGETLALRAYEKTNITRKTVVAIYTEAESGFLITAFLTSKPSKVMQGLEVIWSRYPLN